VLACEHIIYESTSLKVYIIDTFYSYRWTVYLGFVCYTLFLCYSVPISYRYICYKNLQMVGGAYLQLGSNLVDSCLSVHILASLPQNKIVHNYHITNPNGGLNQSFICK